jgi:hypothetical protein
MHFAAGLDVRGSHGLAPLREWLGLLIWLGRICSLIAVAMAAAALQRKLS